MDARFGTAVAIFCIVASVASAAPVTEKVERFELDWTAQRVRYYGEAKVSAEDGAGAYDVAAKRARAEGGVYARNAAASAGGALGDGAKIAAASSSTGTTYYGDGSVRVYLEAPLADAFAKADAVSADAKANHTGIVLQLSGNTTPTGTYVLVDESGRELYAAGHLGGRWLKRPSGSELAPYVGDRAATVAAQVLAPGRLRIARADWDKELSQLLPLLNAGAVALVLP